MKNTEKTYENANKMIERLIKNCDKYKIAVK